MLESAKIERLKCDIFSNCANVKIVKWDFLKWFSNTLYQSNFSSLPKSQTCFLIHSDMICKLLKSASHPFSIFFQRQVECSQQIHQVILKKQTTKTRAFFFESPEVNSRCCILNACRIKEMCAGQFTRHLFGILRFNPFYSQMCVFW